MMHHEDMTEQHQGHESHDGYTDEAWDDWKDYADVVTVQVNFRAWMGAEDNDETWYVESDGAAWPKDWLTRQLVDLAAADATNSCCGVGNYSLNARDSKTEWGASGAVFEAVLTLSENLLSEATWVALGAVGQRLAARLKARNPEWSGPPLTEEQATHSAQGAVLRASDLSHEVLKVVSVEFVEPHLARVEVRDQASGDEYTVDVRGYSESVRCGRIRKIIRRAE